MRGHIVFVCSILLGAGYGVYTNWHHETERANELKSLYTSLATGIVMISLNIGYEAFHWLNYSYYFMLITVVGIFIIISSVHEVGRKLMIYIYTYIRHFFCTILPAA